MSTIHRAAPRGWARARTRRRLSVSGPSWEIREFLATRNHRDGRGCVWAGGGWHRQAARGWNAFGVEVGIRVHRARRAAWIRAAVERARVRARLAIVAGVGCPPLTRRCNRALTRDKKKGSSALRPFQSCVCATGAREACCVCTALRPASWSVHSTTTTLRLGPPKSAHQHP